MFVCLENICFGVWKTYVRLFGKPENEMIFSFFVDYNFSWVNGNQYFWVENVLIKK